MFAALAGVLPPVFTPDAAVLAVVPVAWWFFVALQPVAGVVFALDGVLLGAGDAAFLRTSTLAAAVIGFLPLIWASLAFGWGLAGIWSGLAAFMLIRLLAVLSADPLRPVGGAGRRARVSRGSPSTGSGKPRDCPQGQQRGFPALVWSPQDPPAEGPAADRGGQSRPWTSSCPAW